MTALRLIVVTAELVAVLVAVTRGQPRVLTTQCGQALPAGPFQQAHRSLQAGLRAWVEAQTHHPLGYVEQLYTFADQDRIDGAGRRVVSVGYLGLTRESDSIAVDNVGWQDWYGYFPWEDWRNGIPSLIERVILPGLATWAGQADIGQARIDVSVLLSRLGPRASMERTHDLQYELLFGQGWFRSGSPRAHSLVAPRVWFRAPEPDHRRIGHWHCARAGQNQYRPVMFELMPAEFSDTTTDGRRSAGWARITYTKLPAIDGAAGLA